MERYFLSRQITQRVKWVWYCLATDTDSKDAKVRRFTACEAEIRCGYEKFSDFKVGHEQPQWRQRLGKKRRKFVEMVWFIEISRTP